MGKWPSKPSKSKPDTEVKTASPTPPVAPKRSSGDPWYNASSSSAPSRPRWVSTSRSGGRSWLRGTPASATRWRELAERVGWRWWS